MKRTISLIALFLFSIFLMAHKENTAEVNDLEAQDPPGIQDGEVYVGTGPGAGSFVNFGTPMEEQYGIFNVLDYGAIPDAPGTTNDTCAILNTIEAASLHFATLNLGPQSPIVTVYFPPGIYDVSDVDCAGYPASDGYALRVDKISGLALLSLRGPSGANIGAALNWVGTAGVGVGIGIFDSKVVEIAGLQLSSNGGANWPQYWIDFTPLASGADFNTKLHDLNISGGGINIEDGCVNCNLWNMRFDGIDGYAIELDTSNFEFSLDHWTYDARSNFHSGGKGLIWFGTGGSSDTSHIAITNGRMESDGILGPNNLSFFTLDKTTGGPEVMLLVQNVDALIPDGTDTCLFDMVDPAPGSFSNYNITIINGMFAADHFMCGDWGAHMQDLTGTPTSLALNQINVMSIGNGRSFFAYTESFGEGLEILGRSEGTNTSTAIAIFDRTDPESADLTTRAPTLKIQPDGKLLWSSNPGTNDDDVSLDPSGANTLTLGSGDSFVADTITVNTSLVPPTAATPPACAAANAGALYYDSDTDKLCYCKGDGVTDDWVEVVDGTTDCTP